MKTNRQTHRFLDGNSKKLSRYLTFTILSIFIFATSVSYADAAPTIILVSPAAELYTNMTNNTLSFAFNYTDADNATMNCTLYIDSVAVGYNETTINNTNTPISSNISFTEAIHFWNISCIQDSNTGVSAEIRNFTADYTFPSISSLASNATSGISKKTANVNFTVTANDTNVKNVTLNGTLMALSSGTTYWVSETPNSLGCTSDGICSLTATITDKAGQTNTTSYTLTIDDTAPTVNLLNISINTTSTTPAFTFNFTDALSPNASCSLYLNGIFNQSNVSTLNNSNTILSASASDGTYTTYVNCTDLAGNVNKSAEITLVIDNVAPAVAITMPVLNYNASSGNITINATVTDAPTGVYSVRFNISNASSYVVLDAVNSGTSWTASINVSTLSEGIQTITVLANDTVGNLNNTVTRTFNVDRTAPIVNLVNTTKANGYYKAGEVINITVNYTEVIMVTGGTPNLTLDTGGLAFYIAGSGTTTLIFNYTVAQGQNSADLTYAAIDSLGLNGGAIKDASGNDAINTLLDPATFTAAHAIVIDNTAPAVAINEPAFANKKIYGSYNFSVTVTETNIATYTIRNGTGGSFVTMTLAGAGVYWAVLDTTSLTDGTQTMLVNVTDQAGLYNDSVTIAVLVDNTKPTITINSAPVDKLNTTSPTFTVNFTVIDASELLNCSLMVNNIPYNSTGYIVLNGTSTNLSATISTGIGAYLWNITCYDNTTTNVGAPIGNSNTTTARTYNYDDQTLVINSIRLNESDIFVSNAAPNNNITVMINATDAGVGVSYITVNFSALNQGVTLVNATRIGSTDMWYANMTVTDVSSHNFDPLNITIADAKDNAGNSFTGQSYTTAILYNMTTPPQMPLGCQRFGNLTTNLSTVLNFNSVNFIIQVEMNGSCLSGPGGGSSPWEGYQQVMMMNFSSLNMSSQTIGQGLANLKDALQVNITKPHEFGLTRVYVNETVFAELNTNTTITLSNIPFASIPAIVADNTSRIASNVSWTLNTPWNISIQSPPLNISVPNGNLRFSVGGFSGYNITDSIVPTIVINNPIASENMSDTTPLINLTINGTGTQISAVTVYDGATQIANYTTANCNASSIGSELFTCLFNATPALAGGAHTLIVNATDYGGASGNIGTATQTFTIDNTAPVISDNSPIYTSNQTPAISAGIVDAGLGVNASTISIDRNGTTYTYNCTGNCTYNSTTGAFVFIQPTNLTEGVYLITINASDLAVPVNKQTLSWNMTVDKTAPVISSFTLSDSSVYKNDDITGSCSATDNLDSSVTTAITGIDTDTAGTFTATCTATDDAGNSITSTKTYTVSTRPSTTTATTTTPTTVSQSTSYSTLSSGTTDVTFAKAGLALTDLTLQTTETATDVRIAASSLTELPADVPKIVGSAENAPTKTYGYLKIEHTNLDNSKIGEAKIKFKVEKSKLAADGFNPEDVALYRYTAQWDKLSTSKVSDDAAYYYFEAISPGLSYFTIGTAKQTAVTPAVTPPAETPATTEPVETPPPAATPPPPQVPAKKGGGISTGMIIAILAAVIIAAALFFFFKGGKEEPAITSKSGDYADVKDVKAKQHKKHHTQKHEEDKDLDEETKPAN